MLVVKAPSNLFPGCRGEWGTRRRPDLSQLLLRRRRSSIRLLVKVRAAAASSSQGHGGYTRIPLETAGAYRLIDKETGESFIVWGGADDDDAVDDRQQKIPPIPSKDALYSSSSSSGNWKPSSSSLTSPSPSSSIPGQKHSSGPGNIGAFTKLKAQRVKALIRNKNNRSSNSSSSSYSPSPFVQTIRANDDVASLLDDSDEDSSEDDNYADDDENIALAPNDKLDASVSNFLRAIPRNNSNSSSSASQSSSSSSSSPPPARGWGNTSITMPTSAPIRATRAPDAVARRTKQSKKNASPDSGFFSRKSFKDLGCGDDMIQALKSQQFIRPSHVQAMSYAPVSQGKSCIIADQSGSGKTLAYLTPLIQRLRQEELLGLAKSTSKNPRVIILVPTAELASQVSNNCRSIAKYGLPFRSVVATGGFRQRTQLESLHQGLDVLIATPGRFIYLLNQGFLELNNLKCVVLDEVDILFGDEGFEEVLQTLISSAPVATQYLFVTATLPVDIYNKLVELFPDCEVIMGPGMHRTSSGLEEFLVDCSGVGEEKSPDTAFLNKKSALLQLVEESPVLKTIVFCNKIETCRKVENILKRFDRNGHRVRVLPFHAAIEQELRLSNMKEFLSSKANDSLYLICTDRASRGIDFRNVDHVVLFDFPRDPSEYVRRVGRTARGAGGRGKAFVFAVGKQVSLAQKIIERNQKGHPLHNVPNAYEVESSIL